MSHVNAVNRENSASISQKTVVLSPSLAQRISAIFHRACNAIKNFISYIFCRGPKEISLKKELSSIELETMGKSEHQVKMKRIARDIQSDSPLQKLQRKADEKRVEMALAGHQIVSLPSILSLEKIDEARFKIEQLRDYRQLAANSELSSPALFGLFEKFVPQAERDQVYQSLGTPSLDETLGQILNPPKRSAESAIEIGKERAREKNGRFYREALMDLLIDHMDRFASLEAKIFLGKLPDNLEPTSEECTLYKEQVRDYILVCVLKELEGEKLQTHRDFSAPHILYGDEVRSFIEKERILSPEKDRDFYQNPEARLKWYVEMFQKHFSEDAQAKMYSQLGQPRWYERFSSLFQAPTREMMESYIERGKKVARENCENPEALVLMTDLVIQQLDKQIRELRSAHGL